MQIESDRNLSSRWRPRFSLLTALLLMTIVGMAIVVSLQWHKVGPLRREVKQLRDEVGLLSIEDKSKLHAIEVRTNENLFWKWRIWVPEGMDASLKFFWGNIPLKGYPAATVFKDKLRSGEQWVSVSVQKTRGTDDWQYVIERSHSTVFLPIPKGDRWFLVPNADWYSEGVGNRTKVDDEDDGRKTFLLQRQRIEPTRKPTISAMDDPNDLPGCMIWLEQQ